MLSNMQQGVYHMKEHSFLVEYHGKAWVSVESDTIEEARRLLQEDSCALEDNAVVTNTLEFDIEIISEAKP